MATRPQELELQAVHDGLRNFQDDFVARPHHLGRKIDEFAPPRRGLAAQGQDVLPIIFLEGLEQKEAYQQEVIVGLVGGKAGKGVAPLPNSFRPRRGSSSAPR